MIDHAWGSHHLVVGGAVQGWQIYGHFPTFELGGPDDTDARGRWIPTTSVDQYGATLASWFGIPASALPGVFPKLSHFSSQTGACSSWKTKQKRHLHLKGGYRQPLGVEEQKQ